MATEPTETTRDRNPARAVFAGWYYAPLVLAMLAATLLETAHVLRTPTISADGIIFINFARRMPENPRETFRVQDQHPGYPALLLGATRVVQWLGFREDPEAWMLGGLLVSATCGVLCVGAVWLLTRSVFDVQVANVAAMVFAVLPVPVWNAADAHSDSPHLLFYLTAAWLASVGMVHGRLWPLAAAGAVSAVAYWIRPEGLEVFLIAQACVVWQAFRTGWSWSRLGLATACLAGVALLVAAPYPILAGKFTSKQLPFAKLHPVKTYISQVATETAPTQPATVSPATAPDSPSPASAPQPVASVPTATIAVAPVATLPVDASPPAKRYRPALVLKLVGKAIGSFLTSFCQGLKFVFIPFYLLGHVALLRRRHEPLHIGFLALLGLTHFAALLGVFILSGYIAHRHLLPIIGLTMPLVGLGLVTAGEYLALRLKSQPKYAVLAVLAVSSIIVLPYTLRATNREFVPVIAASRWVQQHAAPGTGVVSNSPYVAFYGQLPVTYLSSDVPTLDDALARAASDSRFDFVVLHVGAHDYHEEWVAQLAPHYHQVQDFPDHLSGGRSKRVLVFQANEGHVMRPGGRRM